jgi:hypothetical protein
MKAKSLSFPFIRFSESSLFKGLRAKKQKNSPALNSPHGLRPGHLMRRSFSSRSPRPQPASQARLGFCQWKRIARTSTLHKELPRPIAHGRNIIIETVSTLCAGSWLELLFSFGIGILSADFNDKFRVRTCQ